MCQVRVIYFFYLSISLCFCVVFWGDLKLGIVFFFSFIWEGKEVFNTLGRLLPVLYWEHGWPR